MTNTGKLMIVGLLVVDAGVAGYLLYPRDDQAPAVTGTVTRSVTGAVESAPQTGTTRAAGGSVLQAEPVSPAAPRADIANNAAIAPQSAPRRTDSAAPSPAQAPAPAPSLPATAAAPAPGVAPDSSQPSSNRIDSAAPPAVNPAAVAHARSKPQSYAQQAAQPRPQPGPRVDQAPARRRDDTHPNGTNPVAAQMTNELVRESAKPDPSLPMPSGATVPMPAGTDTGNSAGAGAGTGRGTNPVASAMTDQLVRESSKVTPPRPAAEPPLLNKP